MSHLSILYVVVFHILHCFADNNPELLVRSMNVAPRYRVVSYLVRTSETFDAKVKGLNIPQSQFYTHVHFAWEKASLSMSAVALEHNEQLGQRLVGANLVLPISSLADLYAPGNISNVIDFATNCYTWARPKNQNDEPVESYVSALRMSDRSSINRQLIRQTSIQFKLNAEPKSYHFVWENHSAMDEFMVSENYTKVICGNTAKTMHPCDWRRVGLSEKSASSLCLYRMESPNWKWHAHP